VVWTLPDIVTRDDAVALAVFELAAAGGLEAVTIRAVARGARMAAGTITNNYASRDRMLAVIATVLGRWVVWANEAALRAGGLPDLLPGPELEDLYRRLLMVWAQLEAHALTSTAVAGQVGRPNALALEMLAWHVSGAPDAAMTPLWLTLRGLQAELLRPGTGLTREAAAALLAQAWASTYIDCPSVS
jgi:AcrR family transcriptional regulator